MVASSKKKIRKEDMLDLNIALSKFKSIRGKTK